MPDLEATVVSPRPVSNILICAAEDLITTQWLCKKKGFRDKGPNPQNTFLNISTDRSKYIFHENTFGHSFGALGGGVAQRRYADYTFLALQLP